MMFRKLTRTSVAAAVLLIVLGLVAQAQPVTIQFWHFYGGGNAEGDMIQWAVDEFNRRYQGQIVVEPTIVGFWEMHDKYPIAMAAGIAPDVVIWNLDYVRSGAKNGLLTNLTPLIERDGIDLFDYFPAAVDVATYQNQVFAIPFNPDTRPFYYNRALFGEAGLDPNVPPERWDDLKDFTRKLTRVDGSGNFERLGFHPMWGDSWFVPWLHSNSGRWFNKNGDPIIASERNVESLEFVVSFIEEYGIDRLAGVRPQLRRRERQRLPRLAKSGYGPPHERIHGSAQSGLPRCRLRRLPHPLQHRAGELDGGLRRGDARWTQHRGRLGVRQVPDGLRIHGDVG